MIAASFQAVPVLAVCVPRIPDMYVSIRIRRRSSPAFSHCCVSSAGGHLRLEKAIAETIASIIEVVGDDSEAFS